MSVKSEKYKSKSAMMKHEKTEPMSMRMKEYGKKAVKKSVAKKAMPKKMGKKK